MVPTFPPKRWLEMNPGGRRHPKKELDEGRGSKNSKQNKVLIMELSIVENLSGLSVSIFKPI